MLHPGPFAGRAWGGLAFTWGDGIGLEPLKETPCPAQLHRQAPALGHAGHPFPIEHRFGTRWQEKVRSPTQATLTARIEPDGDWILGHLGPPSEEVPRQVLNEVEASLFTSRDRNIDRSDAADPAPSPEFCFRDERKGEEWLRVPVQLHRQTAAVIPDQGDMRMVAQVELQR